MSIRRIVVLIYRSRRICHQIVCFVLSTLIGSNEVFAMSQLEYDGKAGYFLEGLRIVVVFMKVFFFFFIFQFF